MKKSILIISAVIVLGIIGIMLWGRSSQTIGVPQDSGEIGSMTISEKLFDFGTISMKNGLVNHIFKITNSSDKNIYVKKINTSCMCTTAYIEGANGKKGPFGMEGMGYLPPANETIKAGESRDIKVVYDPNAHGPSLIGLFILLMRPAARFNLR
jgi:hypothetical protein